MSIRGLWILTLPGKTAGKVIFSRFFPTIERKTRILEGDQFVAVPDDQEFGEALYGELGWKNKSDKFVESRDTCRKSERKPVYEISTAAGRLWPLVVIEQFGLIFCCLPAVEKNGREQSSLIQFPGIPVAFSLLLTMMDFLGPCPGIDENFDKFPQLHLFLSQAAPFGTPVDQSLASVDAKLHSKLPVVTTNQKQPAWKPILHKGKGILYFTITENMRTVQYDSPNIPDVYEVYGTVSGRSTLEGLTPDITLTLGYQQDSLHIPVDDIVVNPCVQHCDIQTLSKGANVSSMMKPHSANPHKIRFTPPLESIALCHYTARPVPDLPIKGFYQMKGETTVDLLVQLRLNDKVKNSFEYCELQMPFFHRGPIIDYEASPNHGQCLLSPDKKILVWNIGQKFPSRSLEILLKASVRFKEYSFNESNYADEQFCVGQNAFAQLFFKIEDYTLSGSWIDPKSIVISPPTKHKVTFVREFLSLDYKIWNSHGDAQMAFPPPRYLLS
ncbi:AP-5 complex subunit mu-1-like [Lineus longissimus]|uniref:AP-5 complex subunit mu-1-like n=1 Tax=Lineus longissimus TaxID=88925 RepID=UPI002B4E82EB